MDRLLPKQFHNISYYFVYCQKQLTYCNNWDPEMNRKHWIDQTIPAQLEASNDDDQDLLFCFRKSLEVLQELVSDVKGAGKQCFACQIFFKSVTMN